MTASRFWWDLTTTEIEARDLSGTVVILPVAAVEQHGPHLPLRTDAAICAGVLARALARLPDDADVLVLPALPVGKSDEHGAFPGTLTLSTATLSAVWTEIAASIARAGARRIVFLNAHGGQTGLLDMVCRDIRIRFGMLAVHCSWFRITPMADLFPPDEIEHGIHGGDIETSVMRALHPDLVAMEKAEDFRPITYEIAASGSSLTAEGAVGFGWRAEDLHPSGAMGNAAAATVEKGEIVLDRAADAFVRLLADIAAFDLTRLGGRG